MCSLNKQLASEKSEIARTQLLRRISRLDSDIDEFVYKAYGLTESEQELVEGSTLPDDESRTTDDVDVVSEEVETI
jgi:hypothetical protein